MQDERVFYIPLDPLGWRANVTLKSDGAALEVLGVALVGTQPHFRLLNNEGKDILRPWKPAEGEAYALASEEKSQDLAFDLWADNVFFPYKWRGREEPAS